MRDCAANVGWAISGVTMPTERPQKPSQSVSLSLGG